GGSSVVQDELGRVEQCPHHIFERGYLRVAGLGYAPEWSGAAAWPREARRDVGRAREGRRPRLELLVIRKSRERAKVKGFDVFFVARIARCDARDRRAG